MYKRTITVNFITKSKLLSLIIILIFCFWLITFIKVNLKFFISNINYCLQITLPPINSSTSITKIKFWESTRWLNREVLSPQAQQSKFTLQSPREGGWRAQTPHSCLMTSTFALCNTSTHTSCSHTTIYNFLNININLWLSS